MRKVGAAVFWFLALAVARGEEGWDAGDPYWPGLKSPKLITPQWIGEEGVEAVVILSIDDMRDTGKYESFLRPILDRLKKIDGRAPLSITTLGVDPADPQLQSWLTEGVSIESHTMDHPCPLLAGGDFAKAKSTVNRNIDLLFTIPNTEPVAYRMPCCDSMNAVSPRFFAEILHKKTESGAFLRADSSVFNLFTPEDKALPKELIAPEGEADGRFAKYVPLRRGFVNVIRNYPYPYTISNKSWQIPGAVPSDWSGQNVHGSKNPRTVADWKAAIDCTVIKQGVFTLVFHPHGWVDAAQVVELIDHAVATHGKKVKFLTLREAYERLRDNLPKGRPLRDDDGGDNGVRLSDQDGDGFMDIYFLDKSETGELRYVDFGHRWNPKRGRWTSHEDARPQFAYGRWPIYPEEYRERDFRAAGFPDLDGDGTEDFIFSDAERFAAFTYDKETNEWTIGLHGKRGERDPQHEIPMIARADGTNNGAWFADGWMYVQHEGTGGQWGQVERRRLKRFLEPLPAKSDLVNIKPKSPEEALRSMQTRPELEVQLVAAEPLVKDPVDIAWGPDGKLWVVEMADYPNGTDGKGEPGGRVRFLEDEDGDGRYDKSTLFLYGLNAPTGVMPWRGGVLVTAAPQILWAVDTDGDGAPDKTEVLYDGFRKGNPQHRVNGLRWGLDNWIYIANGDSDGIIRSAKTGKTVNISGRDLRIRPDEGLLEAQSGETQFGRVRDDWGNWFGNNNSNALWHYVLPDHYLRRNPHVASPDVRHMVPEEAGRLQLYPASTTVERFNDFDTANRITSACGTGLYGDVAMGEEFYGNAFVCEPVHNLVTRQVLAKNGLTFTSHRAEGEESSEFLSSSDNWFRPVTARTGPDGALYIVDMYRHVIEHPEWIPKLWQMRLNLRAGEDKGRIYRVVRRGQKVKEIPRLDGLKGADLVSRVSGRNSALRDMAHVELLHREDRNEQANGLRTVATTSKNAQVRLQALSILEGLGIVRGTDLLHWFDDASPEVRRNAVRVAEGIEMTPALIGRIGDLLEDSDSGVRQQIYFSLGSLEGSGAEDLLVKVLLEWDEPEQAGWFQAAIMSSVTPEVAKRVLASADARIPKSLAKALEATAKGAGQRVKIDYVSGGVEQRIGAPPKVIADQLRKHAAAAELKGDVNVGRTLFGTHCAICHRLSGAGNEVGPDLAALTDRSFASLSNAIIDPNAALEDKFEAYTVTTRDGSGVAGMIYSETSTSMILKQTDGTERTVLKKDIRESKSTGRSLMPEGFGVLMESQQIADLIAYLQSARPPAKTFAGNSPAVVSAEDDGSFALSAAKAQIYGPRLAFGEQHQILEYWHGEQDHAIWEIECKQAGRYKVDLDFGCQTGNDNRVQIIAGESKASAVVPQTKTWTDFQRKGFGTVELREGRQEIEVRSEGPVNNFLIDIRNVFLVPSGPE